MIIPGVGVTLSVGIGGLDGGAWLRRVLQAIQVYSAVHACKCCDFRDVTNWGVLAVKLETGVAAELDVLSFGLEAGGTPQLPPI